MIKRLLKSCFVQNIIAFLASLYIRLVFKTNTWKKINFEIPLSYLKEGKPFITCFWHSRLLLLPYAWPGGANTFFMLISAHKDGRIISKTVHHFGIKTVAGSTKKGGARALLDMVRLSRQGKTLGITPDGPRGPAFEVSDGTIMASYLSKADLIPVTYAVKRHKVMNSWDRFMLPGLFSKGVLMWGAPITYPKEKKEAESVKKMLKKSLDLLNTDAHIQLNT
ncbi:MAG: lysophospholipid acyltransferase family protein [Alphaproteobacteria bacterium]